MRPDKTCTSPISHPKTFSFFPNKPSRQFTNQTTKGAYNKKDLQMTRISSPVALLSTEVPSAKTFT